jgi:CheY-like chemotaxis protein
VPSTPPVVLIVDDHPDSLAMYALGLLIMGFQPLMAESAEEAFSRACESRPDVVVTDVGLGGASGLELTRQLRSDFRTKNAGIIVLSGHAGADVQQQADAAGCDRYIVKPCLPDTLALEIRGILAAVACVRKPGPGQVSDRLRS